MKIRFHQECRADVNRPRSLFLHPSSFIPQPSPRAGIALVITLIMLAVTLVMAVAFLAISTRERGSVTSSTDANHARLATEAALAHAEAQVIATILSTTNAYNFGMFVSTNFINRYGFNPSARANPTNVNYDYVFNGAAYTVADLEQNIANLEYLPRAPVFVPTNAQGKTDFRFFLDLNRNRQFDDTGLISNTVFSAGRYLTNGNVSFVTGDPQWIGVLEHPDQPHGPLNPFIARYAFIAVPVGNTLDVNAIYNDATRPDQTLKPGEDGFLRNEGVGSWEINLAAFLADLNTNEWDAVNSDGIYNYQTAYNLKPAGTTGFPNTGGAFDDALSMLRYRYNDSVLNQPSLWSMYYNFTNLMTLGTPVTANLNQIDEYSDGPLMTSNSLPVVPYNPSANYYVTQPWAGADNTNHFFGLADFFNPAIFRPAGYGIPANIPVFTDRLLRAGTNNYGDPDPSHIPTYDRYTFYRMLEQLGTDSEPQVGKININYKNVDVLADVLPAVAKNRATLTPWTNSLDFFTNAADLMLRTYTTNWFQSNPQYFLATFYNNAGNYSYINAQSLVVTNDPTGLGLTNRPFLGMTNQVPAFGMNGIPVWVNGQFAYTPAVHRLMQLAANIHDATTTNTYPSVFRPQFSRDAITGNIFISGYTNIDTVIGSSDPRLFTPLDVSALVAGNLPQFGSGLTLGLNNVNVYGVPWIIGAKKGLPNFNELNVLNTVQVSRLLQVNRTSLTDFTSKNYTTNQMLVMSISNSVGMSMWNSYNAPYVGSGNINVFMHEILRVGLTNASHSSLLTTDFFYNASVAGWPGSAWSVQNASAPPPSTGSFFYTNWVQGFLPLSAYQYPNGNLISLSSNTPPPWQNNITVNYPFPQFGSMTTNWSQAYILDGLFGQKHVVDYVQFSGPSGTRNITTDLADPDYKGGTQKALMWSTNTLPANTAGGINPYGIVNQIQFSRGSFPLTAAPNGAQWSTAPIAPGVDTSPTAQAANFGGFFTASWNYGGVKYYNTNYTMQAPYTPTRTMMDYTLWQANDPLVHYLASDLSTVGPNGTGFQKSDALPPTLNISGLALNQLGTRYQPWGVKGQMSGIAGVDPNQYSIALKDPLVLGSDSWDFPTNLLPNVGWLGRVHRGTPWQTVYLKSTNLLTLANSQANGLYTWQVWSGSTNNAFDSSNSAPKFDRWLFDLFTAGPNQNATMGQLSVNQPHLAAWSALFSGIPVLTNRFGTNLTIFEPAGTNGVNNYVPGNTGTYLGYIWNAIQATRTNLALFPGKIVPAFSHLGDVLATSALTDESPFLTPIQNDPAQLLGHTEINDQMYEWLPQQILGLLKLGTPRYVIYCYGQALKPAPNGILGSGTYALMSTNYTVVSESAIRAVVEVQGATGPTPHVILKNVNPLPPD